jgi:uncharacterized protein (DUF433 family)
MSVLSEALTANEAASVTGVPLKHVHRIIDAGLLAGRVESRRGNRVIVGNGLVGLRVAYLTADTLTMEARRRVIGRVIREGSTDAVREQAVTVAIHPVALEVEEGLSALARAKAMVAIDKNVMGGMPCIADTRIPVHDIADMLANGDSPTAILTAYPQLRPEQVDLAAMYAMAYPRRGRPPANAVGHRSPPKVSWMKRLEDLPPAS